MQSEVDGVAKGCSTSRALPLQEVLNLARIVHMVGKHSGIRGNGRQEEVILRGGELQKGANRGLLLAQYAIGASTDVQNDSNRRRRVFRVKRHDRLRPAIVQHGETPSTEAANVRSPTVHYSDWNQNQVCIRTELRALKSLQRLCVACRKTNRKGSYHHPNCPRPS